MGLILSRNKQQKQGAAKQNGTAAAQGRLKLTDVERTAVQVSWSRWKASLAFQQPDGSAWYDGSYDERLVAQLTQEERDEFEERAKRFAHPRFGPHMMGVRTVSLDDTLLRATGGPAPPTDPGAPAPRQPKAVSSLPVGSIRQVAILGAGLDTRAWRLPWPQGVTVFEVDTGTTEALKSRTFADVPLRAATRHALISRLEDLPRLTSVLQGTGLSTSQPTAWLLEGLIGYLTKDAAFALLKQIRSLSAPGSQLLMTAPPSQEDRDIAEKDGRKLFHAYVEPPQDTLERTIKAGWTSAELVTTDRLRELYGIDARQPQIHAIA